MSKSIYSSWSCCIQNSFTKSIDSNQLLKTIAIALNREFHSYKVNVKILSWLSFEITISWLEIWSEIAWIQQKHYFELIFLLQLVMQSLLRQRLMTMSTMLVAKYSLLLLLVAYWNFHYANLTRDDQATQLLFFRVSFLQSSSCYRDVDDTIALTRFLLILSNMNFLSSWSWTVLHSREVAFLRFLARWRNSYWLVEVVVVSWEFESEISNCFFMTRTSSIRLTLRFSTNCADFFNHFDVLDLSLLLWIIESLKWLTFVVWDVNEKSNDWSQLLYVVNFSFAKMTCSWAHSVTFRAWARDDEIANSAFENT